MLFTSLEFLLLFFPFVFGLYFLMPLKARNYFLLLASLVFYAWGDVSSIAVLLISVLLNYLMALRIDELREAPRAGKAVLVAAVLFNVGLLVTFKYLDFITRSILGWFPGASSWLSQTEIALPIGISFFTFKAISYIVDVYRGEQAQKNLGFFAMYLSFFPQLMAGPIGRYSAIKDQLTDRKVTLSAFADGLRRFMIGFNKKVLLANILSELADLAFAGNGRSVCMAWLGALAYTLQIYYDFSGYSDMAIGLAQMLGFRTLENFDYPYISRTITEFWRRWHISLGSWFRDYVYFPLGGSRVKSRGRLILNLFAVWCLTGIWHGANWTFIVWGLLYGVIISAEKLTDLPKKLSGRGAVPQGAYYCLTMLLVILGWVLFRSDSLTQAWQYIKTMFGVSGTPFADPYFVFYGREYILYLIFGIFCSLPVWRWIDKRFHVGEKRIGTAAVCLFDVVQLLLFAVSLSCLVLNTHNPFIYINF